MNTQNTAHITTREGEIRKAAQQALESVTDANKKEAQQSRQALTGWLLKMDTDLRSHRGLVTDELTNVAVASLHSIVNRSAKHMKKGSKEALALQAFVKALDGLGDTDVLDCFSFVLKSVFDKMGLETRLFSKNLMTDRWEETGFFIDDEVGIAAVSIASTVVQRGGTSDREEQMPYQPIGYINEDCYLPTESSKLLWAREFALGAMVPYTRPFKVNVKEVMAPYTDNGPLSQPQVAFAEELIALLEGDILRYDGADKPEDRAELAEAMRVAIELGTVNLRPLAVLLDTIQADHPEVGSRFENANIRDMVLAVNQFLRERIGRDVQRRIQDATELTANPVTPEAIAESLLAAAKEAVSGDTVDNHAQVWSVIAQFKTLYRGEAKAITQAASDGMDTAEQLALIIKQLEAILGGLRGASPEATSDA